jgi:hypothetical protein
MSNETMAAEPSFLEGPRSRGSELLWALGTFTGFIRGFRALHFVGPSVTVFGSTRFKEEHPYYQLAREIGYGLAQLGVSDDGRRPRNHGGGQPRRARGGWPHDRL